jgi:REP element-mobilizing transposase RayT
MHGIIENQGSRLYRINSMSDHVHLLFTLPPTIAISDFMRTLKASSSKTIKSVAGFEKFKAWGEGYAGLSYSVRDKDKIINYIIKE